MVLDITKCTAGGLDMSEACVAGGGTCQHHGAQYAEFETVASSSSMGIKYSLIASDATIVSVTITTTETCCIVVNAAIMTSADPTVTAFEIERPLATIRTTQEDTVLSDAVQLMHHAAWEVLVAGTYTYYLVNRGASSYAILGAWIKAIASDCLG